MKRRSLLLGTLGLGVPAWGNGDDPPKTDASKGLAVVPKAGPLEGVPLYTNSHAVLIGVSRYEHLPERNQLRFGRKDAEDLKALLVRSLGFPEANITLLVDKDATRKGIERALDALQRARGTDRVLVFFSGHGMTVPSANDQIGVLVPYDANIPNLSGTGEGILPECLEMDFFLKYLRKSPAKHKLLLADACFSGNFTRNRALESFTPDALRGLREKPALQALTASGKAEVSKEKESLQNGVFTRKVIDVLNELSNAPGRVLTAQELYSDVLRRVKNESPEQTPQFGDFEGTEGQFLFVSVDPSAVPRLRTADAKVEREKTRSVLVLTGLPDGAVVRVDGQPVRDGRYAIDLVDDPVRSVVVYSKADGYEPLQLDVEMRKGETVEKAVSMVRIPRGSLVFENLPPQADVTVDGAKVEGSEQVVDLRTVESKTVRVVIRAPGYQAEVSRVSIGRGERLVIRADAVPEEPKPSEGTSAPSNPSTPARPRTKGSLTDYPALRAYVESMRQIPAGTFTMGSANGDRDDSPTHRVTLSAFRMGATPATVAMWKEYCKATGAKMPESPEWGWLDGHPVVSVSWNDIVGVDGKGGFCRWASEVSGLALTLPTEAQWEYAARGGLEGKQFPWGDAFDRSKLWCSVSDFGDAGRTAPVLRSSNVFVNDYGLTDMGGNVWQWCWDRFGPYGSGSETDPTGPPFGDRRCLRGGSWSDVNPDIFRCADRSWYRPGSGNYTVGFRLSAGL